MPLSSQDLERILTTHQHRGDDFSAPLRNQDWNLISRTSLSAAGTTLTLAGIDSKKFLRVYIEHDAKSGNGNSLLRFNNDSGSNYTFIENGNGTARTSQTSIDLIDGANNSLGYLYIIDIVNVQNLVKSVHGEAIARITGAGTAQTRHRVYGSWVNTADRITRIDLLASANNLPANTAIHVYGSSE